MKKRSISLIIGLMALALLGVMGMQYYFLRQSFQLKSQLFDQNVNEALGKVVAKLEKLDANNFLTNKVEIRQKSVVPERRLVSKPKPRVSPRRIRKEPKVESYASMLRTEQRKADSLFSLRDSLYRLRNPHVIAFNDAITAAELKNMEYKLQVDVYQFQDALGQIHERTQQTLSRALRSSPAVDIPNVPDFSPDSVRQYIVFDPQTGKPSVYTLARPKLTNISRPKPPKPREPEVVKAHILSSSAALSPARRKSLRAGSGAAISSRLRWAKRWASVTSSCTSRPNARCAWSSWWAT